MSPAAHRHHGFLQARFVEEVKPIIHAGRHDAVRAHAEARS
ncbi:hypothetical protein A7982_12187 [Minicystis rosea]|nr:hypothetical protein A7982_12187 [Minicystis rosea]